MAREYSGLVVSTDPPYYDNIGYSDLSDYFYVWLRRSLKDVQSGVVGTMLTPKSEELVANPHRHGGKSGAEERFIQGSNSVFRRIREGANQAVPMTVYYAYKQQNTRDTGTPRPAGTLSATDSSTEAGKLPPRGPCGVNAAAGCSASAPMLSHPRLCLPAAHGR